MKKRFKLLTTIASLCLAVALMAFGVYAATSASFKVTSNISFTASEANVSWTLATKNNATYKTATDITNKQDVSVPVALAGTETAGAVLEEYTFVCTNASEKATTPTITFALSGDDAAKFNVTAKMNGAAYESDGDGTAISTQGTSTVTFVVTLTIVAATDKTANYSATLTITGQA